MEWFKKHTDTALILGSILGAMVWMNGKFNQLEKHVLEIKRCLTKSEEI